MVTRLIAIVFPISRWCLRRILESSCRENFYPLLPTNIADRHTSKPVNRTLHISCIFCSKKKGILSDALVHSSKCFQWYPAHVLPSLMAWDIEDGCFPTCIPASLMVSYTVPVSTQTTFLPLFLVLYGKRGTGKSFHASCIANAVIERGFSCLVTDIKQVVNLMESSFEKRSGNLERILAPDLLILEDLGAQRSTEYVMEHVYDVIDGRYKAGKPMVITTNFDFRERILNATADDPWGRVFDRIVEVGFPVKYDGNSRRREIGMKNRKDFKRKLGIEGIES